MRHTNSIADVKAIYLPVLRAAATKAGFDVTDLIMEECTIDRTWGDSVGWGFSGCSDEINHRAAKGRNDECC